MIPLPYQTLSKNSDFNSLSALSLFHESVVSFVTEYESLLNEECIWEVCGLKSLNVVFQPEYNETASDYRRICLRMVCKDPANDNSAKLKEAGDGTVCGHNKVIII